MTAVLGVLLFLLKCLGILLLVLLGLLLLVIVLALLAPVRYRGTVRKKEEPEEVFFADGLVSWLNPFLRVRIKYVEKKLCYTVRIFGICLLNSEKPKKEKAKKEKKKKAKKKKQEVPEEEVLSETVKETEESVAPDTGAVKEEAGPETVDATGESTGALTEATDEADTSETQEETPKKESFFVKIKKFIQKVKAIPEKIKEKVTHIKKTLQLLWHKKEKVMLFLQDEFHILALGKGWDTLKKMLRHILPGKIKGHAEFGTGDPESTGKALAVLGILYAAYGKGLTIVPDFYEKRLVAELKLKGRIRFGSLLLMGLRLIRDKHVKRFYKNLKKLINVLKQKAE